MGKILPSYKKAIYDEIIDNITSNTSHYYAFASNPVAYPSTAANVTNDDYSTTFINDWQLLFGKKLVSTNIYPMIKNNAWVGNTVYDIYDNTSNTLYTNNNFYVICSPSLAGGSYHVYKCINNANGALSTIKPSSIGTPTQTSTFKTGDNYQWRYITSISPGIYYNFYTVDYAPIYANATIQTTAFLYSGVENIIIANSGIGYSSYTEGTVRGNPNTTLIQIEANSSGDSQFYTNNSIYLYNEDATSQIFGVASYIANGTGKWVYLNSQANTDNIQPAITKYKIAPKVVFETDGGSPPVAYSTINTSSNSINSIVILYPGSNISRANVYIQSNTVYGTGANLYAIVPPAGGHGADPATELGMNGLGINFSFTDTQSNTIVTSNTLFNKIGILKNPYNLQANGTKSSIRYTSNTFSQVLKANVSPSYTFTVGETVTGLTSKSKGTVVFSNSSVVYLTGDKSFSNGESVSNTGGSSVTAITINTLGSIYATDIKPLYVQNINNVNRSDTQTETFKLVIKI
jgi:hypothetical protein